MEEALAVRDPEAPDAYLIDGWDSRAPRPGLSRTVLRRARVIAEALFATHEGPPPPDRLAWMERDLADFFGHLGLRARLVFRVCVATLYFVAPLSIGRPRTMAGL